MSNDISRFDDGFETGTDNWYSFTPGGTIERVPATEGGLEPVSGDAYARINGSIYTNFGNYSAEFAGGYTTRVSIYLDPEWATGNGFNYTVASNNTGGTHRRDFAFNVAKDAD